MNNCIFHRVEKFEDLKGFQNNLPQGTLVFIADTEELFVYQGNSYTQVVSNNNQKEERKRLNVEIY